MFNNTYLYDELKINTRQTSIKLLFLIKMLTSIYEGRSQMLLADLCSFNF